MRLVHDLLPPKTFPFAGRQVCGVAKVAASAYGHVGQKPVQFFDSTTGLGLPPVQQTAIGLGGGWMCLLGLVSGQLLCWRAHMP